MLDPTPITTLIDEVNAYQSTDADEQASRERMTELLSMIGDPLARSHFEPGHITASAYVVDPKRRKLLLHHHRRLDRWLQMGGHLEPGETAAVAALREAREESGLTDLTFIGDGFFDLDIHPIPAGKGEPDHSHFDVRYVLAADSTLPLGIDVNESIDLQWFDLDEAEAKLGSAEGSRVIRKIRKLLT